MTARNLVVALEAAHKVHVAAHATWRQALGVERRVLVEAARRALELVLQLEQVTGLAATRLGLQGRKVAHATERHLVQNQEQ